MKAEIRAIVRRYGRRIDPYGWDIGELDEAINELLQLFNKEKQGANHHEAIGQACQDRDIGREG